MQANCPLCSESGGEMLWRNEACRVVRVLDQEAQAFPGFCRVIWNAHCAEMSELTRAESQHLMSVVFGVERVLRVMFKPDKINLASLGNVVPHLHWHVIPRWRRDSHFPQPVWAAALRAVPPAPTFARVTTAALAAAIALELEALAP